MIYSGSFKWTEQFGSLMHILVHKKAEENGTGGLHCANLSSGEVTPASLLNSFSWLEYRRLSTFQYTISNSTSRSGKIGLEY